MDTLYGAAQHLSCRGMTCAPSLIDAHGRTIRYLRISVTDRCDLRCRYCMAEAMTFLPRDRLLSLEEIAVIAERFVARGIDKIRLSGGEPVALAGRLRRPPDHVGELGADRLAEIHHRIAGGRKSWPRGRLRGSRGRHAGVIRFLDTGGGRRKNFVEHVKSPILSPAASVRPRCPARIAPVRMAR